MDDKQSANPAGGIDPTELDLDSFFSSFDFLDDLEEKEPAPQAEAPAKQEPPAAPVASAEPATPAAPATSSAEEPIYADDTPTEIPSLSFLDDTKKDLDDMVAEFTVPEETATPQGGFTVNIPPAKPAGSAPSVTFMPEDADADIAKLYNEIAEEKGEKPVTVPKRPKEQKSNGNKPKKKKNTGEIIRKTVLTIAIITIVVSVGVLAKTYLLDPYLSDKQNQEAVDNLIGNDVVLNSTQEAKKWKELSELYPNVEFAPDMLLKYANLYAANQDMAGWISIPKMGIDLPLVQGDDNSYYLRRDLYKKYTDYGVPFFDYRNDLYFLDRNTIVYGHNMRYSDKIFGMLENYKTVDGFKTAPTIECNTIYEDYTWKIYAVMITNSEAADDNGYVFTYNFTQLNDAQFESYIKEVDKRALYKTGVDINATDNILTLSTCCYDFNSAKIVVIARLLRNGESADVDTSLATKNPNPKYPQAWYNANNKTNPYANDTKWYAVAD